MTRPIAFQPPQPDGTLNVLLIGAGGREHALAWKLAQSPRLAKLFVPENPNPGLADGGFGGRLKAVPLQLNPKDWFPVRRFCQTHAINLVVVGPEEPLAHGLTDALGQPVFPDAPVPLVFGPAKAAAMLEADKAFAKKLMRDAAIPTAEARVFTDHAAAKAFLQSRTEPHVVKAAGLAKGKGVFVPASQPEALAALDRVMLAGEFGDAGKTVVIEERLKGREISVFALTDGQSIYILESAQDHKRLGDGATGPNTGGMGAISPARQIDDALMARIQREVLVPTVDALRREGLDYRGVLYAGLMLTPGGPKVLEFNCRFGDPECQALLRRWRGDLLTACMATASQTLDTVDIAWEPGCAVCVVLAAAGYPDKPRSGDVITGLDQAAKVPGVEIFHAGTARDGQGRIVTAGGRVLSVTATGATPDAARLAAYQAADLINFAGKQVRRDIGTDTIG